MLVVKLTTSENTIKINSVKAVVGRDTCSRLFAFGKGKDGNSKDKRKSSLCSRLYGHFMQDAIREC